jgi:hypothetical protein
MTLMLVVLLLSGETLSREVPSATCAEIAARLIRTPGVSTVSCWRPGNSMRPVFTTVSM